MTKGKKPVEIELKLVLTGPTAEPAIVAKMRENNYTVTELDKVRNVDIYLDTFDWLLMKSKLALRYRVTDGAAMYTIKSIGTMGGGIAKRMEMEVRLKAQADAPSEIHIKQIMERIDPVIYPRRLLEHIQIRTERRRYHVLAPKGTEIELAFDTSSFSLLGLHKRRRAQHLQEMEAEIINGSEAQLKSLALLLKREFPYPPSTASKLEVAIDSLKVVIPSKKPPEKLKVRLDDRLDLTVHKILHYQFNRFREQITGVKRDIDTEFVHQARVATRRMRSALRLFRNAVPRATGSHLEGELKWLGETFGVVRDLDVFLLNLSRFKERIRHFPGKKKKVFEDWIEKHRRTPLKVLQHALESPRYESFERRLIRFFEGPLPACPRATQAVKLVRDIAPILITDKFHNAIEQGRAVLENPKLKEFHRLRIQMKRLRYACEFMAPAYDGALDPFIDRTVELQDCLGEIQDTVFTRSFIDFLRDDWKGKIVDPELLFILGEIYQLQADIERDRTEMFSKIWEQFSSEETIALLREIDLPA
jgi:CHAD domain-containing protein/uncharacterized protein YjbK